MNSQKIIDNITDLIVEILNGSELSASQSALYMAIIGDLEKM